MDSIITVLLFGFLCIIIVVANQHEKTKKHEALANVLLLILIAGMALLGLLILFTAYNPLPDIRSVPVRVAIAFFIATSFSALICLALLGSRPLRLVLQRFIIRSDGYNRHFEADSYMHRLALVLMIIGILNTIGNFVLAGGIEGMAEAIQETGGMGVTDLLVNLGLYMGLALLGIGFLQRRGIKETWQRLGMSFSPLHLLMGAFVGLGLFCIQIVMAAVWQSLVSPEAMSQQTAAAEQIFASFGDSLFLGFLVALTAGLGEELLFRGALQPIFGNVFVSVFFVMLHSQYILTPAALIILVVSLVFGLLRQHFSTSAAIIAHLVYNFSPFLLVFLASQAGLSI